MLTVGLCGGSGTGKNLVSSIFSAEGIPGIDCDAVYHALVAAPSPLTAELSARFGAGILTSNGTLDRARLGSLVFADGEEARLALSDLNRLTHAAVLARCREFLAEAERSGAPAALVNAPLLFESRFDAECDLTVAVLANREARLARITARDGITREAAERRIDAQMNDAELTRRADHVLWNNGTEEELSAKVRELAQHIKKLAKEQTHGKV